MKLKKYNAKQFADAGLIVLLMNRTISMTGKRRIKLAKEIAKIIAESTTPEQSLKNIRNNIFLTKEERVWLIQRLWEQVALKYSVSESLIFLQKCLGYIEVE